MNTYRTGFLLATFGNIMLAVVLVGLWVHYRLAKPASSLHRTLIDCVGGCLSAFDVLRDDRRRLQGFARACKSQG